MFFSFFPNISVEELHQSFMQHVGLRTKPPSRGHTSEHTQIHAEGGSSLPKASLGLSNLFFSSLLLLTGKKILENT